MKIRFKATECGTQVNGRVLTVGASNSKSEDEYHYIAMQALIDPKTEQDMAIHFEIDDQINGNYDLLKSCECTDCDSNPPPQRGKVVSGPPILEVDLASAVCDRCFRIVLTN